MRGLKNFLILYFKGIAMGCADAVPGVSGGTIAFISGIYEVLVNSLRSFDRKAVRLLFQYDIKGFWNHVNGIFLLVLLSGIGTAILSLSRLILYCLKYYPEMLWAFFFGLVVASAIVVSKKIEQWNGPVIISGLLGILFGYYITVATPAETSATLWFVFISGMIAICAMILPGISGSFILVLLGMYEYVLSALKEFNLLVIIIFSSGAAIGILSFSHLLNWTLRRFHNITIAALTGIMVGSLNKVWPWKKVIETYTTHKGEIKPLIEQNILPTAYFDITGKEPYLIYAVALGIIGFAVVYYLEKMSPENSFKA
ncbi:DUF368 domain-containing protein [Desulfonema magnum]|uniref:DUF368 n=1 Tax=Desulfonema magnum TaxID=45655 RepID=A0A975BQY5_9BACT|nr:DUF368 domain-containing protein [Desulfonema magnum]QTA90061.1 DUF368 [Desulfonema magnum]